MKIRHNSWRREWPTNTATALAERHFPKANMPNVNRLAEQAEIGLVKTVPDRFKPASDVANLCGDGVRPRRQLQRTLSRLKALNIGIDMSDTDFAYRCNLVTLSSD